MSALSLLLLNELSHMLEFLVQNSFFAKRNSQGQRLLPAPHPRKELFSIDFPPSTAACLPSLQFLTPPPTPAMD